MATKLFLGVTALIWLPYGIYCFFRPELLAEAAGIVFKTPTGATDVRATYGGLTAAVGTIALVGSIHRNVTRYALATIATACAGLGLARALGAALDGGVGGYTTFALALEFGSLAFAVWLLRRRAAL
jgi:hypothetical protein